MVIVACGPFVVEVTLESGELVSGGVVSPVTGTVVLVTTDADDVGAAVDAVVLLDGASDTSEVLSFDPPWVSRNPPMSRITAATAMPAKSSLRLLPEPESSPPEDGAGAAAGVG